MNKEIEKREYSDIIGLERPQSTHTCMDLEERAKIFAPFAALRGHSDAIDEEGKNHIIEVDKELIYNTLESE